MSWLNKLKDSASAAASKIQEAAKEVKQVAAVKAEEASKAAKKLHVEAKKQAKDAQSKAAAKLKKMQEELERKKEEARKAAEEERKRLEMPPPPPALIKMEGEKSVEELREHLLKLLPEAKLDVVPEPKPSWFGKPLADGEFEVGIGYAPPDAIFAERLYNALSAYGLKVTKDVEKLHLTRVFLLAYSDDTGKDETTLRTLTRAAERFNTAECIIIPVVSPSCSEQAVDKIPDNLAYSLSHTTFFDVKFDLDPVDEAFEGLVDSIKKYVSQSTEYDVSGLWSCSVLLKGESGSKEYELKEFTFYLEQTGEAVTGYSVAGWKLEGKIKGNRLQLTYSYNGKWTQADEGWADEKFKTAGSLNLQIMKQGYTMEGDYIDLSQYSERPTEVQCRWGVMSASKETSGLSGYWDLSYEGLAEGKKEWLAVVHKCGSSVKCELQDAWGQYTDGIWDGTTLYIMGWFGLKFQITMVGQLHGREEGCPHLKGFMYICANGANALPAGKLDFVAQFQRQHGAVTMSRTHVHPLYNMVPYGPEGAWNCDVCKTSGEGKTWHCAKCQYDICDSCYQENHYTLKKQNSTLHRHALTYLYGYPGIGAYGCDNCKQDFEGKSWHCGICSFDLCKGCMDESKADEELEIKGKEKKVDEKVAAVLKELTQNDKEVVYEDMEKYQVKKLGPGEFATCVAGTAAEEKQKLQLKADLEKALEAPVSIDLKDLDKSRSCVLLLSKSTRTDTTLIEETCRIAAQNKPIFNIGLDGWFAIFGDPAWNEELKSKFSSALARLNQTDASTMDPANQNFKALARGIRKEFVPKPYSLTGMWEFQLTDNRQEAHELAPHLIFIRHNPANGDMNLLDLGISSGVPEEIAGKNAEVYQVNFSMRGADYELLLGPKGKTMSGWVKQNGEEVIHITGALKNFGVSGVYKAETLFGVCQVGNQLIINYPNYKCYGIINQGRVQFISLPNDRDPNYSTVCGYVRKGAIDGFYYHSGAGSQTILYKAVNIFAEELAIQQVDDIGQKGAKCPEKWVERLVNTLWASWKNNDYKSFCAIWPDEMMQAFPVEEFERQQKDMQRNVGTFVSMSYIGKRRINEERVRYEFDCDFTERKGWRYYFLVDINQRKLLAAQDLEEEAEQRHINVYDVMISYRSRDGRFIDQLQEYLQTNGILCWRDRRMEVGSNWSEDITFAVRNSKCIISCLSQTYVTSSLCTKEVRLAYDAGRLPVPLVLPPTEEKKNAWDKTVADPYRKPYPPHTISKEIAHVKWVDFRVPPEKDASEVDLLALPDPGADAKDAAEFSAKYKARLEPLLLQLRNVKRLNMLHNINGKWTVKLDKGDSKALILVLGVIQRDGSLKGEAYAPEIDTSFAVNSLLSTLSGSMVYLYLQYQHEDAEHVLFIRAKLDVDGDSFTGIYYDGAQKGRVVAVRKSVPEAPIDNVMCYEDWVNDFVDLFWASWQSGNYNSFISKWHPEIIPQFGKEVFQKELDRYAKFGDYGYSTYLGQFKTEQGLRYDFNCTFQFRDNFRHAFIFTAEGLLVGCPDVDSDPDSFKNPIPGEDEEAEEEEGEEGEGGEGEGGEGGEGEGGEGEGGEGGEGEGGEGGEGEGGEGEE